MQEVQRVAGLGAKSLQLPVFPPEVGLPDYYHERYDPLFALIQETGLPICCHIGLNTMLDDLVARDPTPGSAVMVPMAALSTGEALGMWIMGGVFERFPELKVVFVEPGLGWIAWWLFITDDMVTRQGYELPAITELPSFYFHRNVFVTFIDETDAVTAPPAAQPHRHREHDVVERLPAPGDELAELAAGRRRHPRRAHRHRTGAGRRRQRAASVEPVRMGA